MPAVSILVILHNIRNFSGNFYLHHFRCRHNITPYD